MDGQEKYRNPVRRILLLVMAAGLLGCLGFGAIYQRDHKEWAFSAAVTSGVFAYHMLIRFLAPAVLWIFCRKKYDVHSSWFRPRPWEARLYRFLRVKQRKARAVTYDPREFSLRLHSLEEVVNNMCHAEAVHELIAVLSLLSVFFAVPFGSAAVFGITAVSAAAVDCACVAIQRYNRPRLVKILDRRSASSSR